MSRASYLTTRHPKLPQHDLESGHLQLLLAGHMMHEYVEEHVRHLCSLSAASEGSSNRREQENK